MAKQKKLVLVTGYCRSGTKTMSHFFKLCGLDVPHEYVGEHGTVSCLFHTDSPYNIDKYVGGGHQAHENQRLRDYEFEHVIHLVRNPLLAIPDQAKVYSRSHIEWLDQVKIVPATVKPRLLHAAIAWVTINQKVEQIADFRMQIENRSRAWPTLRKMLGIERKDEPVVKPMNNASGIFKSEPTTIAALKALSPDVGHEVMLLARKYGYRV